MPPHKIDRQIHVMLFFRKSDGSVRRCKDMKPLCQSVEIQAPVLGAIQSIVKAKMTTMK